MELNLSEPDYTDSFGGILTVKNELNSLESWFEQVYSSDVYLLATQDLIYNETRTQVNQKPRSLL